jgi:hypothetical protein
VLGHSAIRTGLEFLPGALLLVVAAHVGGHLVPRLGARIVLAVGMALGALGALLLSGVSPDGSYVTDILPGMLVLDAGIGLSVSAIFITALSGVRHEEAGLVSGLTTTAHELGIALVLPLLSTIATNRIGVATIEGSAGLDPDVITTGFAAAFLAAAVIAAAAAVLALGALRRTDTTHVEAPAFAPH